MLVRRSNFRGSAFDVNQFGVPLPTSDVTWTSNREGAIGTGYGMTRGLTVAGTHIITLRARGRSRRL